MSYILSNTEKSIDLNASGLDRIMQNGRNILSTMAGEVVLNREIGVDAGIVDLPSKKSSLFLNIKRQFEKFEPRLSVIEIKYIDISQDGILDISIEVDINE